MGSDLTRRDVAILILGTLLVSLLWAAPVAFAQNRHFICDNCTGGAGGTASSVTINDPTTVTQKMAVDAAGKIGINNFPTGFNVLNFPSTWDVSDRSTRLLGVVYGSQGQQIQQRATTFDALVQLRTGGVEYDARQIRALTSADVVSIAGTVPTSATIATDSVGLAKDATLTGGNAKAITRGGAKGTTTAADVTSENVDANTQALHVFIKNGSIPVTQSGAWSVSITGTPAFSLSGTGSINLSQYNGVAVGAGNAVHVQPGTGATFPISGTVTGIGNAADNSANSTTKAPVLPCRANAAPPTWTEGNQVPCSTDLAGNTRVTVTNASIGVTPPAITKGTQGATGFTTQDLKDAGRNRVFLNADAVAVATTEALVTFTKDVGGTATASQTTYSVTTGKTLRITAITVSLTDTSTTVARTRVRIRENNAGACTAASALVWTGDFGPLPGTQAAGLALQGPLVIPIPDGMEFPAADSLCISEVATTATTAVLSITVTGFEY